MPDTTVVVVSARPAAVTMQLDDKPVPVMLTSELAFVETDDGLVEAAEGATTNMMIWLARKSNRNPIYKAITRHTSGWKEQSSFK